MNCILASTSTVYGEQYLAYIVDELAVLFTGVETILFIPYARPSGISYEAYTAIARKAFEAIDKKIVGIHEFETIEAAFSNTQGIFTGGGNTFVLVDALYRKEVLMPLKKVIQSGVPYLGTSAGSNICGLTMKTTNDMPIVYPPSFTTLGIVPFTINAHYVDPDPSPTHNGETRATRIQEYHVFNTPPVVGLREGSWLRVKDTTITLQGSLTARIFEQSKAPYEIASGSLLSTLY